MKLFVVGFVTLVMVGCATPVGQRVLEGDWRLQRYLGESGQMSPVLSDTEIDVRFGDGRAQGSGGCNRYSGPYAKGRSDRLTVGPEIASTQMACAANVAQQEHRYFALLALVHGWQADGDRLRLLDRAGQTLLEFVVARPAPLMGTAWQATGINNGRGGVVSGPTTHLATATFADGQVTGNAGCNRFSAAVEIEGNRIAIAPAATTRRHCAEPEGIMSQEQQYLAALAGARSYSIANDTLELRNEAGALLVGYRVHED